MNLQIEFILRQVDLRALAEEAGAVFSSSNSSRCPLHHGDNPTAFHIYQSDGKVWRWKCFTNCPSGADGGTAIDFWMRWKGVDLAEAIRMLKERAGNVDMASVAQPRTPSRPAAIKDAGASPSAEWQKRAGEFCEYARRQLWNGSPEATSAVRYLRECRLLSDEVIRGRALGFNPGNVFDLPDRWGQEGSKVCCPRGIVIPHQRGEAIWYVNVRRPLKGDELGKLIGAVYDGPKFNGPRGGRRGLYAVDRIVGKPVCVIWEGEFDAMLAWQAAHDLADHSTLGGARHRPDTRDAMILARALVLPVILDDDKAADEGRENWRHVSERVVLVMPPAHDATDFCRAHGVAALRKWIAGIVAQKLERVLGGLDMHEQPDLFERCVEVYLRALDSE